MKASTSITKYSRRLTLVMALVFVASCQSFGEFPAPRGTASIGELTPVESADLYAKIGAYLQGQDFIEQKPTADECARFKGFSDKCYRSFQFSEKDSSDVVNIAVYVNADRTVVNYQVEEMNPRTLSRSPAIFSSEACEVVKKLNSYVFSLVRPETVKVDSVLKCDLVRKN